MTQPSSSMGRNIIAGIEIDLGGEEFVVPPLNFKALRAHMETISGITTGVPLSSEQIDKSVAIILAAMQRNYPDMTEAELEERLDMANIKIILPAILGASGIKRAGE